MMFGYPCLFVKGHMAAGLFQEDVFVRLGEPDRAAVLQLGGRAFEPVPGRPMREYVILPKATVARREPRMVAVLAPSRSSSNLSSVSAMRSMFGRPAT